MEAKHAKYQRLLDFCKSLPPTPTAVAHPCDESSLRGAVEAGQLGLISPILVGPRARVEALAKQLGIDLASIAIVDAPSRPPRSARWPTGVRSRALSSTVRLRSTTQSILSL
jgi:phosphate acetyltransferase